MELGYKIPNGQILTVVRSTEKTEYHYSITIDNVSSEPVPIEFSKINALMESLGMKFPQVPEFYQCEHHCVYMLFNASMTRASNAKFFDELELNLCKLFANNAYMETVLNVRIVGE